MSDFNPNIPDKDLLLQLYGQGERLSVTLSNLAENFAQFRKEVHDQAISDAKERQDLSARVAIVERHLSDTPGRFLTSEGPVALQIRDLADWKTHFQTNIKWWGTLATAIATAVSTSLVYVLFHLLVYNGRLP